MTSTIQFLYFRSSWTTDITLFYIKPNQYTLRLLSDEAKIQKGTCTRHILIKTANEYYAHHK